MGSNTAAVPDPCGPAVDDLSRSRHAEQRTSRRLRAAYVGVVQSFASRLTDNVASLPADSADEDAVRDQRAPLPAGASADVSRRLGALPDELAATDANALGTVTSSARSQSHLKRCSLTIRTASPATATTSPPPRRDEDLAQRVLDCILRPPRRQQPPEAQGL